ncbi:acyltransferase family protein [Jeotgalibacillus haloalkalitolerans]|uniref:Acyltransferase family protein n=1 Tax=Jeotgalibacillus haloalkalitolerans TaxID=3104292 RepID=A0ABU5KPR4_9BACL|nr:acyltransferase family protein [Jeotgalibacillus sp. HH7-29]MDZ5712946.1 acyltransferase family protein [Jeotgalibacillus sp. HH7-29]
MSKRDYYFDNAKFILIFLVVFGHAIQSSIEEDPILMTTYQTIYFFHMPAFILIAGYFAKSSYSKGLFLKLLKKLIVPYLIFQLIYTIYYYFLRNQNNLEIDPLNPQWALWFLVSLFFWSLLLILFRDVLKLKWKAAMLISIILGVMIGFVNDYTSTLSLSRTFVFFPFFLAGHYLNRDFFSQLKDKRIKIISVLSLAVAFISIYYLPDWSSRWLFGSHSYEDLGTPVEASPLLRLLIYAVSFGLVVAFFSLAPVSKTFFTRWGLNTLYVYLFHGFIIQFYRESGLGLIVNPYVSLLIIMAASLLLTIFLSSRLVAAAGQPIVELRASKARKMLNHKE